VIFAVRTSLFEAASKRVFYGWVILAVAGLGIFASGPGQSHTFSVFVGPISQDLGLSKTEMSVAYMLATLAAAFLLPRMGRFIDRLGPRQMLLWIVGGLGFACLFFGAAANYLWLILGFGLLRFLGQGSLMLCCANVVSQWFSRRRGFALGLMASGFGVSMAVHPPLAEWLVQNYGWRQAWIALGAMTWLLMLPPVLLLTWDKPEDKGLAPDGDLVPPGRPSAATPLAGLTLGEALRSSAFYICVVAFFSISMLVTTLHFYQVSILVSHGLEREIAARAFPVSAITMLLAMPLVGRLFDRWRTRRVFALALVVQASSLILITFATTALTTILYAIVFGLNNAFSLIMFGYLWPRYFGRRHVGEIQGTGQMFLVVGASLGPLPVGLAFDHLGSPDMILRLLAVLPLLCALATAFLRTPAGVPVPDGLE